MQRQQRGKRLTYTRMRGIDVANAFREIRKGRLSVIARGFRLAKKLYYVCQCDCGEICVVRHDHLVADATTSCGCYHREQQTVHGCRHKPEAESWYKMLRRCNDPSEVGYHHYGGRGISVCARWQEPNGQGMRNFLDDMGPKPTKQHTLDRIDVNGDYCSENCRWADWLTQGNNRRNTVLREHKGERKTLAQWARVYKIGPNTIRQRLRRGWDLARALTEPPAITKKKDAIK